MSLLDQSELAKDAIFIARVRQAVVTACIAVSSEDPATPNHANRITFAQQALLEPERTATVWAMGVASNPAITDQSSDNDIQFTVNSQFDAYAGVG